MKGMSDLDGLVAMDERVFQQSIAKHANGKNLFLVMLSSCQMEYKNYSKRKDKLDKKKNKEKRVYTQKHVRRYENIMETGIGTPVENIKKKAKKPVADRSAQNRH